MGSLTVPLLQCGARSAQADQRQDEHDHDDQSDDINDAMHRRLLSKGYPASLRDVARPALQEPVAAWNVPDAVLFSRHCTRNRALCMKPDVACCSDGAMTWMER